MRSRQKRRRGRGTLPPSLGLAALRLAPLRSAAPPGGQAQRNSCPWNRINLQQQPTQWRPLRAN